MEKSHQDQCEVYCYDEDKVSRVQALMASMDFQHMMKAFKVLADETRYKAAYALTLEKELCVCDVANIIGVTTATASHHLRLLRDMGFSGSRKEGKMVFYSLTDDSVRQLISAAEPLRGEKRVKKDKSAML
ncbi:DNA-binding transcriptional ArsR family regulator [Scopulibacillus daqui]|uniref:DNA-binding transcriptional ArsR family regulator n=1 Tax=Scopulibacillus daqui TaxID=1469162 RepID=A0ABS2Q1X0_9BACL|nr:metalloregulator ArsR/SmtB family transcription factor [Scopulibacillus daqui]MBM7646280.1 DNA-binding transcriptional ArsR family regulator [Scopulibacillus daqui]